MCYVPPNQRWDYVNEKWNRVHQNEVDARRYYFHDVFSLKQANVLRFEGQYWNCVYDDMIDHYHFVGSPNHRLYYYSGVAVLFTDGDLYLCVSIRCKNALSEGDKMQFLRHQYRELLNPMNKLYLPTCASGGMGTLMPNRIINGKRCFQALSGSVYRSCDSVCLVLKRKFKYIFNLYLIRKQSVLRIWKAWKWYKNRKAQVVLYQN